MNTLEQILDLLVPLLVTTLLGIAVPAVNQWRTAQKAGKNKILIDILDRAIQSGIEYMREGRDNASIPRVADKRDVDKVVDYVKQSIPDTLKEIGPTEAALVKKVISKL